MGDLSHNFSSSEFACPCCGQTNMDQRFIEKLQLLRDVVQIPLSIVEGGGYRCQDYNGNSTGAHTEGKAADLGVGRDKYHPILKSALQLGFTGVGIKNKNGSYQLHLDTAEEIPAVRPRPWIWTY